MPTLSSEDLRSLARTKRLDRLLHQQARRRNTGRDITYAERKRRGEAAARTKNLLNDVATHYETMREQFITEQAEVHGIHRALVEKRILALPTMKQERRVNVWNAFLHLTSLESADVTSEFPLRHAKQ